MVKSKFSILELILFGLVVFFLVGYIIFPLSKLFLMSISEKGTYIQFFKPNVLTACFNSIVLSVLTVLGSCVIGVFLAYTLHYFELPYLSFLSAGILLPMATPPIVGVIGFLFLVGDNGLLSQLFGTHSFRFEGWLAIITIHLFSFYPLFYLFSSARLKSMDYNLVEASYTLGANKSITFINVILPQLYTPIIGASILTFMASMASFSAPFIYGGSLRFLTTEIYYSKVNGDNAYAAFLSVLLSVISILSLFIFRKINNNQIVSANKGTNKVVPKKIKIKRLSILFLFILFFLIVISMPIISLIILSFMKETAFIKSISFQQFTIDNYINLFKSQELVVPLFNSFKFSSISVLMALIIGFLTAYFARGKKKYYKLALETIISIPYGIPGTVIGICLILSFNQSSVFSFFQILVGTFWILPIAYTIRNVPIITQSIISGMSGLHNSLEEASYTLGANKIITWKSVLFPLLVPSIIQGSLLVFINSFGEFVSTILLYTYSTKTISISIYSELRSNNNGLATAYGSVLFFIMILILFISTRFYTNKYN